MKSMRMIKSEDCEGSWSFGGCLFALDGQGLKHLSELLVRKMMRSMSMTHSEDCEGSWSFGDCLFGLDGQDLKQSNI